MFFDVFLARNLLRGCSTASQNLLARAINVNYKLGIQNIYTYTTNNLWMSNVEGNKIYSSSTCLEIIMRYFIHFLIHSLNSLACCFAAKYEKIINFPERTKHFLTLLNFYFIFSKKKSVPDFWDNLSEFAQKKLYISCIARRCMWV